MPRYKLIVQKQLGNEFWVNDYYYTATDLDDADSLAQPIIDAEIAVHAVGITVDMYRISTVTPDDGIFRNFTINAACTWSPTGQLMMLWNCALVTLIAASGRSGHKWLRGVLSEGIVGFDLIDPSHIETDYCVPLRALDYLEKQNGTLISDLSVSDKMANRQLRRGSKRRVTPVI